MSLECQEESRPDMNTQNISSPQVLSCLALVVKLEWGAGGIVWSEALEVQVPNHPPKNTQNTFPSPLGAVSLRSPGTVALQQPVLCTQGCPAEGEQPHNTEKHQYFMGSSSWPPIMFSIVMKQFRISNSGLIGCHQPVSQSRQG